MMTIFPFTLSSYRNSDTSFPCQIAVHTIRSSYPSHRHDFLELSLVMEGAGKEIVNGVEHAMLPGTFTFLLPYQIHEIHALPGQPLRLYNCMLSMDLLMAPNEAGWGLKSLWFDIGPVKPAYVQFEGAEREAMLALMQSVLEEFEGERPWRNALVKAKLTEALIRFDRARSGGSGYEANGNSGIDEGGSKAGGRSGKGDGEAAAVKADSASGASVASVPRSGNSNLWKVITYIHSNFRDPMSLAGLADRFHFHSTHLSELIHKHTGLSFVRLLHEIRLRHACALLSSTEMKIADIAAEVGYGSTQTMFRAFHNYKGLSPQAYRRLRSSPVHSDAELGQPSPANS